MLEFRRKLSQRRQFSVPLLGYLQNNKPRGKSAGRVPEQKKATADFIHMLQDYLTHSREHGALFLAR